MCIKSTRGAKWQIAVQMVCLDTYSAQKKMRLFYHVQIMHAIISYVILEQKITI